MILRVGNKVVYPSQGPCIIDSVFVKVVGGTPKSFYHLIVLDESGGELFIPVDKAQAIGIRPLLEMSEIPELLDHLMKRVKISKDWKQRASDNLKLFTSGSAFDLAEIVRSLTELGETKTLSIRENWTLEKARKLLISELSEVMRETRSIAEERVDQALKARRTALPESLPLASHFT
jgi:RNA polymerase-interacting CarD/CdnL/TRCF family regulator